MGQTPGSVDIFSTKIWRTALLSCHYHRPRIEKLTWSSVFECLQHTGHLLSVSEVSREVLMLFCAIVIHFNGHSSHSSFFFACETTKLSQTSFSHTGQHWGRRLKVSYHFKALNMYMLSFLHFCKTEGWGFFVCVSLSLSFCVKQLDVITCLS